MPQGTGSTHWSERSGGNSASLAQLGKKPLYSAARPSVRTTYNALLHSRTYNALLHSRNL
jgi:hypothetical protein